jgi:hypothetical protein
MAISNKERIESIAEISKIIDSYGIILSFQRFSDIALGVIIEIDEIKVPQLFQALSRLLKIDGFNPTLIYGTKDCSILLNITFTKGTGDLEIEVPANE